MPTTPAELYSYNVSVVANVDCNQWIHKLKKYLKPELK
jgi:hypothetical protein